MRARRGLQRRAPVAEDRWGYLWFEDARVVQERLRLLCVVAGRIVPLPVVILHPDCRLAGAGDVGRLGVPRWWAEERGLLLAGGPTVARWAAPGGADALSGESLEGGVVA